MSTESDWAGPPVDVVTDAGLGNSSYLLDLGDRRTLAVDPPRDLRALRAAAERRGLRISHVADTHLHADFLSGARQLAATDGATVLASRLGRRRFEHRPLDDGDEIDLGGLTLRAWLTPGHTDEHLSYVLVDAGRALGVFTGGSLLVGTAARTDLLGTEQADELAQAQYASLQRLAALPDEAAVWPTHGVGSFCSAPSNAHRTSTIGAEKAANDLLRAPDAKAFADRLRASLGRYPAYFDRLAEVNRRGPELITASPTLAALSGDHVRRMLADGADVVDVRPVTDYGAAHIPGAISIPLRAHYAIWLGWLLPPDTPIIVLRNLDQDPGDILWPALNIGYANIVGELAGGLPEWTASGGRLRSTRIVGPAEIDTPVVLDVRQASEHRTGHLPGAHLIELGTLNGHAASLPRLPITTMCGHADRAASAASLLERAGHHEVSIVVGGPADWSAATGRPLQT